MCSSSCARFSFNMSISNISMSALRERQTMCTYSRCAVAVVSVCILHILWAAQADAAHRIHSVYISMINMLGLDKRQSNDRMEIPIIADYQLLLCIFHRYKIHVCLFIYWQFVHIAYFIWEKRTYSMHTNRDHGKCVHSEMFVSNRCKPIIHIVYTDSNK